MISRAMKALMILCVLFVASASATQCPHPCKCFTTDNGIQGANCTDLPDQMTTAWPQKILRIHFESHHASPIMLKNKAFKHFPRLTYLDITGGTIQYVGNSAFDGLPELVELNLVGTGIRRLHRNTFSTNRKLAFVSLRKNPRLFVAPSFLESESITELDISECSLITLKSIYFKSLPNLKYLFAMKNNLTNLGSQFGPPGLKYVNLAHNRIENIYENFDLYKHLRTVDLTGNPVNCTCELSEIDKKLADKGVDFGKTILCKNTKKPLDDMIEMCSDKEMMGDDPMEMYKADHLLKIDNSSMQSFDKNDDFDGSGSGSGDDEFGLSNTESAAQTEIKNSLNNTQIDDVRNNTQIVDVKNNTQIGNGEIVEEIITKTHISELMGQPTTSEVPAVEVTSVEPTATMVSSTDITEDSNNTQMVDVKNNTQIETGEVVEEVITETRVGEPVTQPTTSEVPAVEVTSVEPTAPTVSSTDGTEDTTTSLPTNVIVHVEPSIKTADDNSSTVPSGADHGIVSQTIQAPEDGENVQAKVADYLKSNLTLTGVAAILAIIIIVVIVYNAVCLRKSRSHDITPDDKVTELKEIKYVAANTDDPYQQRDETPPSSVEENLLEDRDSEDDDDDDDDDSGPNEINPSQSPSPPVVNGNTQNGLLSSVMDAVKNNEQSAETATNVPTRVIVKLTETPKACRPTTINNVQ